MAIKFLSAIDLGGLELINAKPQFVVGSNLINSGTPGVGELLASAHEGRIVYDSTANVVKFSDGSTWLDVSGDIRSISAGDGLTGDATSGDVTLAVGAGTGITVNANDVQLDTTHTRNVAHDTVLLTAGGGLTGGGAIDTSRTFAVGAGTGITVNADDVELKNADNLTQYKLLMWGADQLEQPNITRTVDLSDNETITFGGAEVVVSGNLTVNGTTTSVNSNEVNIGDSVIKLNSDETGAATQDAGFEVERGTDSNVSFIWNETDDYFSTVDQKLHVGDLPSYTVPSSIASQATGTQILVNDGTSGNTGVVRKMSAANFWRFAGTPIIYTLDANQGNVTKSSNTYTVTHDLQTKAVIAQVIDTTTFETVHVDVARTDNTTVTVAFGSSVTDGDYMIVLTGARRSGDTVASAPTGPSGDEAG
jgi:hypothetical protein